MKDTLTNVILSIKPVYAEAIMSGLKTIEFRKKVFKRPVNKIYVYASSPIKKIIGYFTISEVVEAAPKDLWESFNSVGGIDKQSFFDYYDGVSDAIGLKVDEVRQFNNGVNPLDVLDKFTAPQSYMYTDLQIEEELTY